MNKQRILDEFNKEYGGYVLEGGTSTLSELDIDHFISSAIDKAVEEERERFIKELRDWFEENFKWGDKMGDDVFVTERELEGFIKKLSNKQNE